MNRPGQSRAYSFSAFVIRGYDPIVNHRDPAFTMSDAVTDVRRAPLLGEHNEYALKHILGVSDDEIAQLVIEGVLE